MQFFGSIGLPGKEEKSWESVQDSVFSMKTLSEKTAVNWNYNPCQYFVTLQCFSTSPIRRK